MWKFFWHDSLIGSSDPLRAALVPVVERNQSPIRTTPSSVGVSLPIGIDTPASLPNQASR